jgi:RNA polymerase sigma-70 factor (ECF subfamily)
MNIRASQGHSALVESMTLVPAREQALEIAQPAPLLARCRQGDQRAWRQLFDAHFDFVRRVTRHLGTPEGELDDVCQECFLVVFRRLESFSEGRFTTWLYRIVANVVSHRHRRRRLRRALLDLVGREMPDQARSTAPQERALERHEAEVATSRILECMSPKKREVFALYEIEGLSGHEIAERLGCPRETVRTRLHYARKEFFRVARKLGLDPAEAIR